MGLFDYVRNTDHRLGPQFYFTTLHTKDLDCLMHQYWISPIGQLFEIDTKMTVDLVDNPSFNEELQIAHKEWIPPYIYVPNGNHGKVRPCYITKTVEVYPEIWNGEHKDWPTRILVFRFGKIEYIVNPQLEL